MAKRIWICAFAIVLSCFFSVASASGLFPSMNEMLGTAMPSVGLAIGRDADAQEETEAGSLETYRSFSGEDYIAFGGYLAGIGATVKEYSSEGNTMTAVISARDSEMSFSYDWVERKAVATYPSGTRAETEKESVEPGDSVLPPVGGVMPSAEFATNRKPDEQTSSEEGLVLTWDPFSDEDYAAFSAYLAETGAALKDSNIDAGVLNAEIGLNGFTFRFIFNWNAQTASVVYPDGTTPESSRWNAPVGSGSVLPELGSLGKELPRISMALEREPSSDETLPDGSLQETYLDFSEADYNTFSKYLQTAECTLEDYHTDDKGVLVINLSNGSGKMTFSYDAVRHTGTVTYPNQTRVERAWAATPTTEPQATPEPTEKVVTTAYSIDDLLRTARTYFYNLRWKNPNSVTIHDISYDFRDGGIVFAFDYSAENGFGGTNRSYYWVTVDPDTNTVIRAFGSN